MKNLYILFLFLVSLCTFSQTTTDRRWQFDFQFDNRYSKIKEHEVVIMGAKIGVQYKKLTRFGVGTSFLIRPIDILSTNKKTLKLIEYKTSFWYVSLYNDWILYKSNHWECFLTEQIGYGRPSDVKEINGKVVRDGVLELYVNEISTQTNYKINTWLGLGAGVGYRNLLNQNSVLSSSFDGPIYIFKVIVCPTAIF